MTIYDDLHVSVGDIVMVRGTVSYSHITTHIEGDVLDEINVNRTWPLSRHTVITIDDPAVVYKDSQAYSVLEQAVEGSFYTPNSRPDVRMFTLRNHTKNLPFVSVYENGNCVKEIFPEGELSKGLDVTVVGQTYSYNGHVYLTLIGVICNEDLRYYTPKTVEEELLERGIVFTKIEQETLAQKKIF